MATVRLKGIEKRAGRLTFEDLKGLRAEGYIRDSTLDQAQGAGPELQRRAIEGFARSYGLNLGLRWYTDFITGTTTLRRSGFQQALQDSLRVKESEGNPLGNAPLGFKHVPRPGGRGVDTVADDDSLPSLLALLRTYAKGTHSFYTLAQDLNARGHRMSHGRPFTASSVSTVLNNRFYEGKVVYHRRKHDEEVIEGVHHVPEEVKALWLRCQNIRRERKYPGWHSPPVRQQRVYPLTGSLVCDECSEPFHGVACRSKGRWYLRMEHARRSCEAKPRSVPAPRIESAVTERVLAHIRLDEEWREAVLRPIANEGPDQIVRWKSNASRGPWQT